MIAPASDRSRARWIAPLLVVILGTVAYSNSFHGPFIFDDKAAIVNNPQICSLNPFKYSSPGPTTGAGRPMLIFSFAVDYAIGRLKVEVYHATNLLIHLLATLILYGIVRRTFSRGVAWGNCPMGSATWLAAVVAALWVTHPLTTQSVTYIVQRAESLASLFLLASIYCMIRSADGSKWWGLGAVVMSGLGMATKELVAAAPLLAILYDRAFLGGSFREALRQRWKIYMGMAAMWGILLRAFLIDRRDGTVGFGLWISPIDYARTELNVVAHYLHLAFWPVNLSLDYYDWPIARSWSNVQWQGWAVLGLAIATLFALRWRPRLGFLGAWFFLILAPTSSILPIKQEAAAEQRMYLPLAAVVCLIVVGGWAMVYRSRAPRWIAGIAACLAVVLLARLTIQRNERYSTDVDIWTDTVAMRPDNARAHFNLGEAWAQMSAEFAPGSAEALAAARQAEEQFEIDMELEPNLGEAVFAMGESLDRLGDPAAAENLYTRSLPKFPKIREPLLVERGNLRARRQDWADARADFLAAIQANPADAEPHYFLGVLYQQLGDWSLAEAELAKAVAISPKYKDAAARLEKVRDSAAGH